MSEVKVSAREIPKWAPPLRIRNPNFSQKPTIFTPEPPETPNETQFIMEGVD